LNNFIDEVRIHVSSGDGGHGCVSFRREKFAPRGGPDGGDGGRGGDVILRVQRNVKTLTHLRRNGKYLARNGQPGRGSGKHGGDGEDVVIVVPPGTIIKDAETGEVLLDLLDAGGEIVFLKGGKGGQGNIHFSTSRNQAPRYAQSGLPGEEKDLVIELALIADIGFLGFPNAGKSTLLKMLTDANPKVGAYPFTTRIPNLGVLNVGETEIILADIPGIIEGASQGAGLGLRFLKHLARVAGIAVLIDLSEEANHKERYLTLMDELAAYGHGLEKLPRIVVGTKTDLLEAEGHLQELQRLLPDETVLGISSHSHAGLEELTAKFVEMERALRERNMSMSEVPQMFVPENNTDAHPYNWEGSEELDAEMSRRYAEDDGSST